VDDIMHNREGIEETHKNNTQRDNTKEFNEQPCFQNRTTTNAFQTLERIEEDEFGKSDSLLAAIWTMHSSSPNEVVRPQPEHSCSHIFRAT
jgi:hypothetical protein